MKTILMMLFLGVGWSFGQGEESTKRALDSAEEAVDSAKDALAVTAYTAGIAEEAMAMIRDERLIAFAGSVRALEVQAIAFFNGMVLIGGTRFGEDGVRDYWTQSAGCLAREVELREVWKILVRSGMSQERRDEIGAAWVKMSRATDALARVLEPALGALPDSARVAWESREKAKVGPRTKEPVIVK